jgi:hypothetical protein
VCPSRQGAPLPGSPNGAAERRGTCTATSEGSYFAPTFRIRDVSVTWRRQGPLSNGYVPGQPSSAPRFRIGKSSVATGKTHDRLGASSRCPLHAPAEYVSF